MFSGATVIAAALSLIAWAIYLFDKFRNPRSMSAGYWLGEGLTAFTAMSAQLCVSKSGSGYASYFVDTIVCGLVAWLALVRGKARLSRVERSCLTVCLAQHGVWLLAFVWERPLLGNLILGGSSVIGCLPLVTHLWRKPEGERLGHWTLFILADAANLGSVEGDLKEGALPLLDVALGLLALFVLVAAIAKRTKAVISWSILEICRQGERVRRWIHVRADLGQSRLLWEHRELDWIFLPSS